MDFSKLSQNEKLAVYGAVAAIIGVVIASFLSGLLWVTLLAGVAMLVVIFLPQFSAGTTLPGSRGSLMVVIGAIAAVAAALGLLTSLTILGALLQSFPLQTIFFLIGVAGGLLMGWAGWQEFQAEGGKLQLGTQGTTSAPAGDQPRQEASAQAAPPPASAESAPPPPVSDERASADERAADDDRPTP